MFVCTVRAATLRFFSVLLLAGVLLAGVTVYGAQAVSETVSGGVTTSVRYDGIRTESDRRAFLAAHGYEVTADAEATAEFTLPKALDALLLGYNELQKEQGLDLGKYAGKTVTRYTYRLPDVSGYEGAVYANLILYRNRVIAADATGVGEVPFVKPLGAAIP